MNNGQYEVAKVLPFNKNESISRVEDMLTELRKSKKLEGYLPNLEDNVNKFRIEPEKVKNLNFKEVLLELFDEKEAMSLPFLVALMKWSIDTKNPLAYQSILNFPFNEFVGQFIRVTYEPVTELKGKELVPTMEYKELEEKDKYNQHLIVELLKALYRSPYGICNSYNASKGLFPIKHLEVISKDTLEHLKTKYKNQNIMDLDLVKENYRVPTIMFDIISFKLEDIVLKDPYLMQSLLRTNQEFIKLFAYNKDIFVNKKVEEEFIAGGIGDGAYSVPDVILTNEFVDRLCEAHKRNRLNPKHKFYLRGNEFNEEKFAKYGVESVIDEQIEKFRKWVIDRQQRSNNEAIEKDYDFNPNSYTAWLKQQELLKAQSEAENEVDNTGKGVNETDSEEDNGDFPF